MCTYLCTYGVVVVGGWQQIYLQNLDEEGRMVLVNDKPLSGDPMEITHGDKINFENCVVLVYETDPNATQPVRMAHHYAPSRTTHTAHAHARTKGVGVDTHSTHGTHDTRHTQHARHPRAALS